MSVILELGSKPFSSQPLDRSVTDNSLPCKFRPTDPLASLKRLLELAARGECAHIAHTPTSGSVKINIVLNADPPCCRQGESYVDNHCGKEGELRLWIIYCLAKTNNARRRRKPVDPLEIASEIESFPTALLHLRGDDGALCETPSLRSAYLFPDWKSLRPEVLDVGFEWHPREHTTGAMVELRTTIWPGSGQTAEPREETTRLDVTIPGDPGGKAVAKTEAPKAPGDAELDTPAAQHVFLSYCVENTAEVARLREALLNAGLSVWWDDDIPGGGDWNRRIQGALQRSFAMVVCFSQETSERKRSGIYAELREVIDHLRQLPPDVDFLIPVRLSPCEIPDLEIDSNRTLKRLQHIDLFPEDKREDGLARLIAALRDLCPTE